MNRLSTPYAVYGTLRSHCGNDVLWDGLAVSEGLGIVNGYRLVTNGGFPYAIPAADEQIVVEVIQPNRTNPSATPDEDAVNDQVILRKSLDRLESYPTFYDRIIVDVVRGEEITEAWLYTPVETDWVQRLAPVKGNDWIMHIFTAQDEWSR